MSKGSKQRKPQVPDKQVSDNWDRIFKRFEAERLYEHGTREECQEFLNKCRKKKKGK